MKLAIDSLSFAYGKRPVLDGISFSIKPGSLVSLLGPNGVGKSTLMRCILGLLDGYGGRITVDGQDVRSLPPAARARRMAYVPQARQTVFPYTVKDMVLMGAAAGLSALRTPGKREDTAACEALEMLGIEGLSDRDYPYISGGEQQLVLLARALAQKASLLLLDEPTANLDYGNQVRVLAKIRSLVEAGYTVLQSSHHPQQAAMFSHEIIAMKGGAIIAQGPPEAVLTDAMMKRLYGIQVHMETLRDGVTRVCVPVLDQEQNVNLAYGPAIKGGNPDA